MQDMNAQSDGQTPQGEQQEVPAEGQAPQPEQKTELQLKLEAAKGNVDQLESLNTELFGMVSSLRKENATKRRKYQDTEKELEAFRQQRKEREESEMSDLERLKSQNEASNEELERLRREKRDYEAKSAFSKAHDPEDVLLHWNKLSAEERELTSPSDWVAEFSKSKPHLFKSPEPAPPAGGNPRFDGGGSPPAPKVITHPRNAAEAAAARKALREMSSP